MTVPGRVLVTADAVGGVWTHAVGLARGLEGRGVEVLLAVLGPAPDEARLAEAAGLRVEAAGLGLEWQDRAGPLTGDARRVLLALEAGFRPDVVHLNGGYREAAAGFVAPVLAGAHSCVRTWWRACRGGEPPAGEWGAYDRGVREGLAAASALAAPTRAFLDGFRAAWGRLPPARVVPNGIDPTTAPAAPKRPFVLAAGRMWDEAKGVADLAAAAPRLPWPVLVAGDGPAGEGVRHLGRLPSAELRALMAEAAVFAAPARYEPFGLAVLEAAASGCALVLGDLPTLRELWDGAARFVPRNEPDALAAALLDLVADEAERDRLGAAARERSLAFTRGRMVEDYLEAYAGLAGKGPLAPSPAIAGERRGEGGGERVPATCTPAPSLSHLPAGEGARGGLPPTSGGRGTAAPEAVAA